MHLIDNCISKFLSSKLGPNCKESETNNILQTESNLEATKTSNVTKDTDRISGTIEVNPEREPASVRDGLIVDQDETIVGEFVIESRRVTSSRLLEEDSMLGDHQQPVKQNSTIDCDLQTKKVQCDNKKSSKIVEHTAEQQCEDRKRQPINIYFRNQMSSNYKTRETQLQSIVRKALVPSDPKRCIKLFIYYRNRKVKDLFIRNSPQNRSIFNVVYQYNCNREPCNGSQTYIGYTTTLISTRMQSHSQQGSIKSHCLKVHNHKVNANELLRDTNVVKKCFDRSDLTVAEALYIKSRTPTINEQHEFSSRTLKVF